MRRTHTATATVKRDRQRSAGVLAIMDATEALKKERRILPRQALHRRLKLTQRNAA